MKGLFEKRRLHEEKYEAEYGQWMNKCYKKTKVVNKARRISGKTKDINGKNKDLQIKGIDEMRQEACVIPIANYNEYAEDFIYIERQTHRIQDPYSYEDTPKSNDSWSKKDIALFIESFMKYHKNFGSISELFYNKRTRDIVEFYMNFKSLLSLNEEYQKIENILSNNSSCPAKVIRPPLVRKIVKKFMEQIDISIERKPEYDLYRQCKVPIDKFTTKQLIEIFAEHSKPRQNARIQDEGGIDYWIEPRTSPIFDPSINETIPYFRQIEQNATRIKSTILKNSKKIKKYLKSLKSLNKQTFKDIKEKEKLFTKNKYPQRLIAKKSQSKVLKKGDINVEDLNPDVRYIHSYYVVEKDNPNFVAEGLQDNEEIEEEEEQDLVKESEQEKSTSSDKESEQEAPQDEENSGKKSCKDKRKSKRKQGQIWSLEDKEKMKKELNKHGKDFDKIAEAFSDKTPLQIKNFFTNYFKKLKLWMHLPGYVRRGGRKPKSGIKRIKSSSSDKDLSSNISSSKSIIESKSSNEEADDKIKRQRTE
ncbi:unnamed protein product [Moneuplotes crassus]|uniref:SANT domain-containing protein n=1 Tax=Euplotes crassus TaxID=5936 RepID=A0AAD1Y8L2_EUPCR|nr:unnamed protein product [Moneuplotes crassus]